MRELEYASRRLTAIEINATYYRTQSAASFAKWRDATPDGFVFAVKASRYATNRRVLGEAGESVARFVASGISELGDKLGPLVWQFARRPSSSTPKRALRAFGYDCAATGVYDQATQCVVAAFQRRFRPTQVDGIADGETRAILEALR